MRRIVLFAVVLPPCLLGLLEACTTEEVVGVAVGGVGIQPPTTTVHVGESVQLTAVVTDDRGGVLPSTAVTWSANPSGIISLSSTGVATGIRTGTADVTAALEGVSGTAHVIVVPTPVFDFSIVESGGATTVTEAGETDDLAVVLLSQPFADVVLDVTSADPGEATVTPATLTFTASTWDVSQVVSVTGVDDDLIDGDQLTSVTVAVDAARSDTAFHRAAAKEVAVLTTDDESPGFIVTGTGGGTTAIEGGAPDTVMVVLEARPNADVLLVVSVDEPSDAEVAPTSLTFSSGNWSIPQPVTFSAVDDAIADGTRSRTITISVDERSDPAFVDLSAQTVGATTVDDESSGWTLAHTGGGTTVTEGGTSDSVSVTVDAQPASRLVLDVSVDDTTDAEVSPSTLTFTRNGSRQQWIRVVAVDDPDLDGSQARTITTSVSPSSDASFRGLPDQSVSATTLDDDVADYLLSVSGGTTVVGETGGSDTFTLTLTARPASDVTFGVTSADVSEILVSPTTLTFARSSWNQPQTVTVTGVDDALGDGDQSTDITIAVDPGSDAAFADLSPRTLVATTVDDDGIGFTLAEANGTIVNEAGDLTDGIVVSLQSVPLADVVLAVTSDDPGEVTVSPATLSFTPANASQPQALAVTGVDDPVVDGDVLTALTVAVDRIATLDTSYDTVTARSLSVTTLDDETASFTVTETGGGTTVDESGALSDVFRVTLGAQPLSDVVLTVTSADPGEVVVDSASLTFTAADWHIPKTIGVMGVVDDFEDDDQITAITISVDDANSDDLWDQLGSRTLLVTTLDVNGASGASFAVSETGGRTLVDESGTTDTLSVVLGAQPLSSVVLTVTSDDPGEVVADSGSLTFTATSWDTPKMVIVRGVDDDGTDGPQITPLTVAVDERSDAAFADLPARTLGVTTTDDEVADFAITQTQGTTVVSEDGSSDAFQVVLLSRPNSRIDLSVTSSDVGEVTVSPTTVSFPPGQWDRARTVFVGGVDDQVVDGDRVTLVVLGVEDADPNDPFSSAPDKTVSVTTIDDEVAGFKLLESGGDTSVDESGTTDTITVVLDAQPTATVVLQVTSADTGEAVVGPATLTFSPSDWATPRTVVVMGVSDGITDGTQLTDVTISADPASSQPAFAALQPQVITVRTTDID